MVQNSWVNLTENNRGLFPVGTVLQYSCDPGYLPDGPSILTCTTLGHWSSEPPQCIRTGGKILVFIRLHWPVESLVSHN